MRGSFDFLLIILTYWVVSAIGESSFLLYIYVLHIIRAVDRRTLLTIWWLLWRIYTSRDASTSGTSLLLPPVCHFQASYKRDQNNLGLNNSQFPALFHTVPIYRVCPRPVKATVRIYGASSWRNVNAPLICNRYVLKVSTIAFGCAIHVGNKFIIFPQEWWVEWLNAGLQTRLHVATQYPECTNTNR